MCAFCRSWVSLGLGLLIAWGSGRMVQAEEITWNSPGGGDWCEPGNWYPEDIPDEDDENATLPGMGPYTVFLGCLASPRGVTVANPDATLSFGPGWMQVGEAGFRNHGTILTPELSALYGAIVNESDGRILVEPGATFAFGNGLLRNDGLILVNTTGAATPTCLRLDDTDGSELGGSGSLLLQAGGNPENAAMTDYHGTYLNQQGQHTVHGDGLISVHFGNAGRVAADVDGRVLRMTANSNTNSGLLEAIDGGILELSGTQLTQSSSGILRATDGTVKLLNSTCVNGGTLLTAGDGIIEAHPGTPGLADATLEGELVVFAGSKLYAGYDAITNNGTITLNPDRVATGAALSAWQYHTVTIGGTGEVVMCTSGDITDSRIETTGETMINGPLHTIRGAGSITCPFTNEGLIQADDAGHVLRLQADKGDGGILEARNGGILELAQAILTQTPSGVLRADGSPVRLLDGCRVVGGAVGTGNGGIIESHPGNTALCEATLTGELDVLGGARLYVGYDTVVNDGTITLNPHRQPEDAILTGWPCHTVTIAGMGEVLLCTDGDINGARIETTGETMVNGPQHTIRGEGLISCAFTNQGVIAADASDRTLLLNGSPKSNEGLVTARSGGILELAMQLDQSGAGAVFGDGGIVRLSNGTVAYGVLNTANEGIIQCAPGTSGMIEVHNQGAVEILPGARLHAGYGTLTNDGTITLNPDRQPGTAVFCGWSYCNVTLGGTGEIVMCTSGDLNDAILETWGGCIFNGEQHTIRGEGALNVDLRNNGLVVADVAGRTLQNTVYFTNGGTLEASGGGTARFTAIGPNYWGGGLHGGNWNVYANSTMRLHNAYIAQLDASVLLDGPNSNLYADDGTADALAGLGSVTAAGRLEVRNGRALAVSDGLQNEGTVVVGPGGMLSVPGAYVQAGDSTHGLTRVEGVLASMQPVVINGGVLEGHGEVSADLLSGGEVRPGSSPGTLTVDGDYTQSAAGTLVIELAGLSTELFDRLAVGGEAHLGGTLVVRAGEGFAPPDGSAFEILSCSQRYGEFDEVVFELAPGGSGQVLYDIDAVTIVISAGSSVEEPEIGDEGPLTDALLTMGPQMQLTVRAGPGGEAILALGLPEASWVRVDVYDVNGRRVVVPVDGPQTAGTHTWRWDGTSDNGQRLPSGIYLVRAAVSGAAERRALRANLAWVR
ncbi:MAG: FlgD immunoglobulin-like domain containing protein [Candidatus Eisenbacteria bacterium]